MKKRRRIFREINDFGVVKTYKLTYSTRYKVRL